MAERCDRAPDGITRTHPSVADTMVFIRNFSARFPYDSLVLDAQKLEIVTFKGRKVTIDKSTIYLYVAQMAFAQGKVGNLFLSKRYLLSDSVAPTALHHGEHYVLRTPPATLHHKTTKRKQSVEHQQLVAKAITRSLRYDPVDTQTNKWRDDGYIRGKAIAGGAVRQ